MSKAYDAFISYSHSADGKFAPSLQEALQRLAKPWHKRKALEVFRDDTGLSVNPNLWTSITEALDGSDYFLLLASPEAADSVWVQREIEHWVATKPVEKMLPVLTSGEWVWDEAANDFDWERSTAVSPALAGVFKEEPRHLDLRWAADENHLDLRHSDFRDATAQLAAPMHGMAKDELEGEDVRLHRRARRLARMAVLLLLFLFVTSAAAGVLALNNARDARASEKLANQETERALAAEATAEEEAERARQAEQKAQEEAANARAAEDIASEQRDIAQSEEAKAVAANARAEEEAANAIEQAAIASQQRDLAEAQTVIAGQERDRAESQTAIAEEQSALAARRAAEAAASAAEARASADEAARQAAAARLAQEQAEAAADEAERQATLALASKLGADSLTAALAEPDAAISRLLAAEAVATFLDAMGVGSTSALRSADARATGGQFNSLVGIDLPGDLRAAVLQAVGSAGITIDIRSHEEIIFQTAFSPGCRSLATLGSGSVAFTRMDTWREVIEIDPGNRFGTMRFSADGSHLEFEVGPPLAVPAVARALPSVCDGLPPTSTDARMEDADPISVVSPDGAREATTRDGFVVVHPPGDPLADDRLEFYATSGRIESLAWRGDSDLLAVGFEGPRNSSEAGFVLDLSDLPPLGRSSTNDEFSFPVLSENGHFYVDSIRSCDPFVDTDCEPTDGQTVVWDVVRGTRVTTPVDDTYLFDIAHTVSDDGGLAIAEPADQNTFLELVNLRTGTRVPLDVGESVFNKATMFAPDSTLVATGMADGSVRLFDTTTGALVADVDAVFGQVGTVAISRRVEGRRLLAVGAEAGTIHLFDISDAARPVSLGGEADIGNGLMLESSFSPDLEYLAFATTEFVSQFFSDGEIGLIRLDGLTPSSIVGTDGSRYGVFGGVEALGWNNDGTILAAAGLDNDLQLIDVTTRFQVGRFAQGAESRQVAFPFADSDSIALTSFGFDQRVIILDFDDAPALELACRSTGRELTQLEYARFVPEGSPYRRACQLLAGG